MRACNRVFLQSGVHLCLKAFCQILKYLQEFTDVCVRGIVVTHDFSRLVGQLHVNGLTSERTRTRRCKVVRHNRLCHSGHLNLSYVLLTGICGVCAPRLLWLAVCSAALCRLWSRPRTHIGAAIQQYRGWMPMLNLIVRPSALKPFTAVCERGVPSPRPYKACLSPIAV